MSKYTDAVERTLAELKYPSIGACPGCEQCRDLFAPDMTMEEFEEAWHSGDIFEEGSFSWSGCGICGSRLGGDMHVWHWVDDDNEIIHEDDACIDCVMYMCNGDEPDEWEG